MFSKISSAARLLVRRARGYRSSIAIQLFVCQMLVVVLVTGIMYILTLQGSSIDAHKAAAGRTRAVSTVVSLSPVVKESLAHPDSSSSSELYRYLEEATDAADVTYAVIANLSGVDLASAGLDMPVTRDVLERAKEGRTFTADYSTEANHDDNSGGLDYVSTVSPINSKAGTVVGVVVAGVDANEIQASLANRIIFLVLGSIVTIVCMGAAQWGFSRYLRRLTWNRGAAEISRMFAYYESVLHSVHEGMILLDDRGWVVLLNEPAIVLLDLPEQIDHNLPRQLTDLPIPRQVLEVLANNSILKNEFVVTDSRVLVVNYEPVVSERSESRTFIGSVATIRDRTTIQQLSSELETVKTLTTALRSQAHEFANKLHAIGSLFELGKSREAATLATEEIASIEQLTDDLTGLGPDPFLEALLLGKSAEASERHILLVVDIRSSLPARMRGQESITIIGNLVDNAMDAVENTGGATVTLEITDDGEATVIQVTDSGTGPDPAFAAHIFDYGISTKPNVGRTRGVGLALVRHTVQRLRGTLTVEGSSFAVRIPNEQSHGSEHRLVQRIAGQSHDN